VNIRQADMPKNTAVFVFISVEASLFYEQLRVIGTAKTLSKGQTQAR
jgi:hypothetical protein